MHLSQVFRCVAVILTLAIAHLAAPANAFGAGYQSRLDQAAGEIARGNWVVAAGAARQAYAIAQTDSQRVRAARLVASAYFRARQLRRAEWWLRKALNSAPDAAIRAALEREIAQIRWQNPLTLRFSLSLAPSTNINNGYGRGTVRLWGRRFILSPDARALPGIEIAAGVNARYRLKRSGTGQTTLGFSLQGRDYRLSRNTLRAVPGLRGSDYSYGLVEASLIHRLQFGALPGGTTLRLDTGQVWYGRKALSRHIRGSVSQEFWGGPDTVWLGFGSLEWRMALQAGGASSQLATIGAAVTHDGGTGDVLSATMLVQGTGSANEILQNRLLRAALSYQFARPVLGAELSLWFSAESREFPVSPYRRGGRHDLTVAAGAAAVFPAVGHFGFSPVMRLEVRDTRSSVALFSRNTVAFRVGVRSDF